MPRFEHGTAGTASTFSNLTRSREISVCLHLTGCGATGEGRGPEQSLEPMHRTSSSDSGLDLLSVYQVTGFRIETSAR
jgi:hypothetical protein